jgi:glycosyltransferase involved in cell wall biosynthesis
MNLTVIIVTYNRCQSLAKTLESVAVSSLPTSVEWEVLVVDNNSTDPTLQVVQDFRSRYPGRFRYLREPNPGKSFGLNAGILASRGDILAFIDDDVTVESTWLQNLAAALESGDWAGAGGRILLERNFSPPRWLALDGPCNMGGMLARFDLGDNPGELQEAPYGTNMAFRKSMFEKYGLFRTDLGPSPNRQIPRPNEDTEFGRRLIAAGERLYYEPSAVVHHPVPPGRLTREYFLAWWFDYGRATSRERWNRAPVWGIPRYCLSIPRMIATHLSVRVLQWMWTLDPQRRFFRKGVAWMSAGQIAEIYRLARGDKKQRIGGPQETKIGCNVRT